ncbi:MAG: hypothetical protein H2045_03405 [Rhizobiales bacterium]|nr:hypothetical protein [Hyphomicrobiales bacterium]
MKATFAVATLLASGLTAHAATEGKRVTVTGEIMDTWCYYSGVMGGQDAVVGSAHHTCAIWCAAGGIPVGLLTDTGEVYLVLEIQGVGTADGKQTVLEIQSDRITADAMLYERDGFKYLVVEKVTSNEGITKLTHADFGVVPGFAIPDTAR